MAQGVDRPALRAIAAAWNVDRIWDTTSHTIDSLLGGRHRPLSGRIWARHLWSARERTVLERHLEQWLAPFSALPPLPALRSSLNHVADEVSLPPGETRRQMAGRSARAVAHAFKRQSDHDRMLESMTRDGHE